MGSTFHTRPLSIWSVAVEHRRYRRCTLARPKEKEANGPSPIAFDGLDVG